MQRPTQKITTALGNIVEIKTYLTQGERAQVQKILAGDTISGTQQAPKTTDLLDALSKALELAIVSLNESTENPTDKIINELPASEYDEIAAEVLKLVALDLATAK